MFTTFPLMLSRNASQTALARERAESQGKDEVAMAQRAATKYQDNPLLIDDRRSRAAQRHNRTR